MAVLATSMCGCLQSGAARCADGSYCPSGTVCDEANGGCRSVAGCGDGTVDDGEVCDDGNQISGDGCAADCMTDERCGNGIIDPGELCDDGNLLSHDGCSSACATEVPTWRSWPEAMPHRDYAVATYDAARGRIVHFGGGNSVSSSSTWSDTWLWDQGAPRASTSEAHPPARVRHVMVFDASREVAVLFGGSDMHGVTGEQYADTWEFDGVVWTRAAPATSPPGRKSHAMAYDAARQRVVLYGGFSGGISYTILSDTWEWDGTDWSERRPPVSPGAFSHHVMAYDPARERVVLYGRSTDREVTETWEWDGDTWSMAAQSTLSSRSRDMVYDARLGAIVRVGGTNYDETTQWNGTNWTGVPTAVRPPEGGGHSMAYDAARQRTILVDGRFEDAWELTAGGWAPVPAPSTPGLRSGHAASALASRGAVVLFGGVDPSGDANAETWIWSGNNWRVAEPGVAPTARSKHAMCGMTTRVLLFGGVDATGDLDDTWAWDGGSWTRESPGAPAPEARGEHALGCDGVRGEALLFGGRVRAGSEPPRVLGDTWTYSPSGGWRAHAGTGPDPRARHAMAYDPSRQRVVLFGGETGGGGLRGDTWEWDGATWALVANSGPGLRAGHVMFYDPARRRVLLFGGVGSGGEPSSELWEWNGAAWTRLATDGEPSPRSASAAAYDPVGRVAVVSGGLGTAGVLDEIWTLAFTHPGAFSERCGLGLDADADGARDCADPDCWGVCSPTCPPGTGCASPGFGCGDGECQPALESCRACPEDCGACAVVCGDFLCDGDEDCAADCAGP